MPDGSMICDTGTVYNEEAGRCEFDQNACQSGTVYVEGECRDPADVQADVPECSEPNDGAGACQLTAPQIGESTTISGCITPYEDTFNPGSYVADEDIFVFEVSGPTTIEVTVDGYGGLTGGFYLVSGDAQLVANDWIRFGINLVSDMAHRQVFLPKAGTYAIVMADSKALFFGTAGNPDGGTCYLATFTTVGGLPTGSPIAGTATGNMDGTVVAHSVTAQEGALMFNELNSGSEAAVTDLTVMINGNYVINSPFSGRGPGDPATNAFGGLAAGDEVLFVVDPIYNFALGAPRYDLSVFAPGVVAIPTNGSVAIGAPDNSALLPYSFGFIDATAGDIMHLDFTTDTANGVEFLIADSGLFVVSEVCSFFFPCTDGDTFVQFADTGRYYFAFGEASDPQVPFTLTVNARNHIQPVALTDNSPITGKPMGVDGTDFYRVTPANLVEWWSFTGAPTGFGGNMEAVFYGADISGELGNEVIDYDGFFIDAAADIGRIVDDGEPFILQIRDTAFAGSSVYDLTIADRNYTDLGAIDEASPVDMANIAINASEEQLFLVQGPPFYEMTVEVEPVGTEDMVFTQFSRIESRDITDIAGAGGTESDLVVLSGQVWIAMGISEFFGVAGNYNLRVNPDAGPYLPSPNDLPFVDICNPNTMHPLQATGGFPPGDEGRSVNPVELPFSFNYFGQPLAENLVYVYSNGFAVLEPPTDISTFTNLSMPNASPPNSMVAPGWDDLDAVTVCADNSSDPVIIQWQGVKWNTTTPIQQQLRIHSDGSFDFIYGPNNASDGFSSTVGVEDQGGTDAKQLGFLRPEITLPNTSWTLVPQL